MAEYYSEYGGYTPKKPRRSLLMRLVDGGMSLLSVAVAVAMAATFFVPHVNPSRLWFLPVLGLAAPAIYVATVLLALYWIIRWRWGRASVMLVLLCIGFFRVSLFYRPEIRRVYDTESSNRGTFVVMSYNVRSFYGPDGGSSVDDVLRLIDEKDPDVVCLQEFNARLAGRSEEFALLDEKYESAVFGRTQAPDSVYGSSLLILSKYRILRSGVALTPSTSVWADLLLGGDTVRVFNNHLRSTAIKAADDEYITNRRFLTDTAGQTVIRGIVARFRENSVLRAAQVDSIAERIARTRGAKIVCGDFNDTPMSYVYSRMSEGLNDAFRACGSGYSHTFRGFFNTLRIDYVLSSDLFEIRSYEVPEIDCSDHLPVAVRLRRNATNS